MKREPDYIDVDSFVPEPPEIEFVKKESRTKVIIDLTGPGDAVNVITVKKRKKSHLKHSLQQSQTAFQKLKLHDGSQKQWFPRLDVSPPDPGPSMPEIRRDKPQEVQDPVYDYDYEYSDDDDRPEVKLENTNIFRPVTTDLSHISNAPHHSPQSKDKSWIRCENDDPLFRDRWKPSGTLRTRIWHVLASLSREAQRGPAGPWLEVRNKLFMHGHQHTHLMNARKFPSHLLRGGPLKPIQSYQKMSGSITRISQSMGCIVISSAASGGSNDASGQLVNLDPYNRDGNLIFSDGITFQKLPAHMSNVATEGGSEASKVYTVNDVAFDPFDSSKFVSCGEDKTIQIWSVEQTDLGREKSAKRTGRFRYPEALQDLKFSSTSLVAASCHDGHIYLHGTSRNAAYRKINAVPPWTKGKSPYKPGAFEFGHDHVLFASSEADDPSIDDPDSMELPCLHAAYDITTGQTRYVFNRTIGCGDAVALDHPAERLALITKWNGRHTLDIYDVKSHNNKTPMHSVMLPAMSNDDGSEVEMNHASFSPDGILLAIGQSNDTVLIYDTRYVDEPLTKYQHKSIPGFTSPGTQYGITGMKWETGWAGRNGALGLVTAGSDGCVRLWDVGMSSDPTLDNMVAQVDHPVAAISVGQADLSLKEFRLVVADCGGGVTVFD